MKVRGLAMATVLAAVATATAVPAFADDGWYRHERREWREHEWREHAWRERQWRERYYVRPSGAAPRYYAPPPAYYGAPRYYR
jgi:hypothetical protein